MPAPHPPEFRRRAVEPARERTVPVAQLAGELGISDSCLRNRMARADVDEGRREGLTTVERAELVRLRRENRWAPVTPVGSTPGTQASTHRDSRSKCPTTSVRRGWRTERRSGQRAAPAMNVATM